MVSVALRGGRQYFMLLEGDPNSIRGFVHVWDCSSLQLQWIDPGHGWAGSKIGTHWKVIITQGWPHAPDSWHKEGAHVPVSPQILVEEHGLPTRSIENTIYTSVSPFLCTWFLINNRLALAHVNLNSGVTIAKPCAFDRHVMLCYGGTVIMLNSSISMRNP